MGADTGDGMRRRVLCLSGSTSSSVNTVRGYMSKLIYLHLDTKYVVVMGFHLV